MTRFDPERHHRRTLRLRGYDYSRAGVYAITICTYNRECLLGDVVDNRMVLNDPGEMIRDSWINLPNRFPGIEMDVFIIMPNHMHGILLLSGRGESCIRPYAYRKGSKSCVKGDHKDRPYAGISHDSCDQIQLRGTMPGSLGRIVQAFKSITTNKYLEGARQSGWIDVLGKLWQRNYYERIVRDQREWNRLRSYVIQNPANWDRDPENSEGIDIRPPRRSPLVPFP